MCVRGRVWVCVCGGRVCVCMCYGRGVVCVCVVWVRDVCVWGRNHSVCVWCVCGGGAVIVCVCGRVPLFDFEPWAIITWYRAKIVISQISGTI